MTQDEDPPRRTQAERREEAESKLLQAATRLIAKKGLDGFKLAEVGEAAGYSRGLPVHYFGTKETLLIRVTEFLVDTYRRALAQHPEAARGLPRLEQKIRHYASMPVTTGTRALGVLIAHARVLPSLSDVIHQLNEVGVNSLESELRAGVAAGNVRPEIDCRRIAQVIHTFQRGQLSIGALDPAYDAVSAADDFLAMLLPQLTATGRAAVAPSKGRPRARSAV